MTSTQTKNPATDGEDKYSIGKTISGEMFVDVDPGAFDPKDGESIW